MQFLHPLLALGALLFLGPLLIHLLNRQRYRRLPWAAMRFLLAAHKRTRRRVQLQNLLLLLLRCLAIIILALGLARLFMRDPGGILETGRTGKEHRVIVVDASYSMAYRERGQDRSLFDLAVDLCRKQVQTVEAEGGEATILLATEDPRSLRNLRALSKYRGPSDEALDLGSALRLASTAVRQKREAERRASQPVRSRHALVLITDRQRASFFQTVSEEDSGGQVPHPEITAALQELADLGVQCAVQGVGPARSAPNAAVVAMRVDTGVSSLESVSVDVSLRNHGDEPIEGVELSLWLDGQRQSTEPPLRLEPSAESIHTVVFNPPTSGFHALEVRIATTNPGDVGADNRRATVVEALESPRVLVVNGAPARTFDRDAASLLAGYIGFALRDDGPALFRAEVIGLDRFRELVARGALGSFRIICLANPPPVRAAEATALGKYVAAGGGLITFLGDRLTDPDKARQARLIAEFNEAFLVPRAVLEDPEEARPSEEMAPSSAERLALLPGTVVAPRITTDVELGYYQVAEVDFEYPAFRGLAAPLAQAAIKGPAVFAFFEVRPDPAPQVRVPARYDRDRHPFLLERIFGQGRSVLVTTGSSLKWNELWRKEQTAIPILHDLFDHLARPVRSPVALQVRQEIRWQIPYVPEEIALTDPDQLPVDLSLRTHEWRRRDGGYALPVVPLREDERPERAGVYRLVLQPPLEWLRRHERPTSDEVIFFSKNVDPAEGELRYASTAELQNAYPQLRDLGDAADSDAARWKRETADLSRLLLWVVFGLLAVETILNSLFSRARKE